MVEMRKPIPVSEAVRLVMEHIHVIGTETFHLNIHMEEFLRNQSSQNMMSRPSIDRRTMDSLSVRKIQMVHRGITVFRSLSLVKLVQDMWRTSGIGRWRSVPNYDGCTDT